LTLFVFLLLVLLVLLLAHLLLWLLPAAASWLPFGLPWLRPRV
jgi:hypothetical protein